LLFLPPRYLEATRADRGIGSGGRRSGVLNADSDPSPQRGAGLDNERSGNALLEESHSGLSIIRGEAEARADKR
jgi:hypothetical protein